MLKRPHSQEAKLLKIKLQNNVEKTDIDNNIELKIGGKFEILFLLDNKPGLKGSEGCKILSFLPEKMFSFSWNAPPHIPEIRDLTYKTWVVVEFIEINKHSTNIKISHLGWLQGEKWDETYRYFENAWPKVLEALF